MENQEEKIQKFLQAMTRHAEEQSRRIHDEVEAYKKERLFSAEKKVFEQTSRRLSREREELKRTLSREFSERDREARETLLRRREEMAGEVFAVAAERLKAYTETPAYAERLARSLCRMAETLPAAGTVYTVGERDAAHVKALAALCPAGSTVETAPDIRIGGLRGASVEAGMLYDDTLDTALLREKERFCEQNALAIDMQPMGLADAL